MNLPVLAIDKNLQVHNQQSAVALKRGFKSVRADSMSEGISLLTKTEFLAVTINADNINYLPQLRIMSDAALNCPVLVVINSLDYTLEKHIEAISNGAFAFGPWSDTPEKNVDAFVAFLRQYQALIKRPKKSPKPLYHRNIMLHPEQYLVVVNDEKLNLTTLEYRILYYFMSNCGRTLTYKSVLQYAWGSNYEKSGERALFTKMKDLRKKLAELSPGDVYIENVRGVGYIFII